MTGPDFLRSRLPLVAAPMAGGPTSVALALAVAEAGAFPFLAAGYKSPGALDVEIARLADSGAPFGVNVFVPGADRIDDAAFAAYARELQPDADRVGVTLDPTPVRGDDDYWQDKLALLRERPVPVVSFTFALPARAEITALQRAGSVVLATVTSADEARAAVEAGVDGLVVQGWAAGGHSAIHDPTRTPAHVTTAELVRAVRASADLPVVAGGAVGTLLLRTDESGATDTHKDALADPAFTETVIAHAFTGRPARGLRNGFVDRHEATAPLGYPAIHHLTRALRQAAARDREPNLLHLWAGTAYRAAPTGPAADVITALARDL